MTKYQTYGVVAASIDTQKMRAQADVELAKIQAIAEEKRRGDEIWMLNIQAEQNKKRADEEETDSYLLCFERFT